MMKGLLAMEMDIFTYFFSVLKLQELEGGTRLCPTYNSPVISCLETVTLLTILQ